MVTVPSVSCQLWCPKVSKGERREAGIQWIQPPKAVSDPKFRQTTSGAHGSANRADCLPRGKPFGAPAGARLFPCRGTDAPTPAREQSLQPYGAFTLFFRWRKKSVQKKASGTATTGKRLLLPILAAGLAMSRAMKLGSFHLLLERARARLFLPSKWTGLFPFAAYRRSVSLQVALGKLKRRCLGCFGATGMIAQRGKTGLIFILWLA